MDANPENRVPKRMARPAQGTLFDTFDFGTPQTRNGKKGNSRWRTAIIYGLLILLLLVSFVGFFLYRFDPFSKPTFPTEAVLKGTFIDTIDVNGTLTPRKQEIVTTTLTGPISEIWVAEGDMVDEGQALFEVDTGQGYTDVTAPIAGQIVQLNLSTGKSYGEQNGALSPGLIIADLSLMEVSLDVNEVDIPHIELGQGAVLSFDALPDLTLNATVAHVATLPNEGAAAAGLAPGGIVVTYPVTLGLEQDDSRLKPGMSVSARITVNEITDVLLVNALAIDNLDDSTVVYVQEPSGEVVSVEVDVLASSPTQIAVEGELAEGEQVVIDRGDTGAGTRSDLFMVRSRFSG